VEILHVHVELELARH